MNEPAPGDTIFIRELKVDTVIGVYERERLGPQPLVLSLELGFDNRVPAGSDDLADTLDYADVCAALRDFAAGRSDLLLEVMAEEMAAMLNRRFGVQHVRLCIDKPEAARSLGCAGVGVRIERRYAAA